MAWVLRKPFIDCLRSRGIIGLTSLPVTRAVSNIPSTRSWCDFTKPGNGLPNTRPLLKTTTTAAVVPNPQMMMMSFSTKHFSAAVVSACTPLQSSSSPHHIINHPHNRSTFDTNRVYFHSSASLLDHHHKNSGNDGNKQLPFGEQMSLRLINENGFLSWTRNSYLSAAAGAAMLNSSDQELIQHAGVLVFVVSAMNMAWGSGSHFCNLIRIRDRIVMSKLTLFLNLLGTVLHALLWLFILGYYIHRLRPHMAHHQHHHHHPDTAGDRPPWAQHDQDPTNTDGDKKRPSWFRNRDHKHTTTSTTDDNKGTGKDTKSS